MVERYRPLDGDPVLRIIFAAILANRFSRPTWLAIAGPRAPDIVRLVTGWRFALELPRLTSRAIRASQKRARRALIIPEYRPVLTSPSDGAKIARRAMLEAVDAPIVAGGERLRSRSFSPFSTYLRAMPFVLYQWPADPLDENELADREHRRGPAAQAVGRFLDRAFPSVDEAESLDVPQEWRDRLAAADSLCRLVTRRQHDRSAAQLVDVVRMLAFVAGKREVTVHELRIGMDLAVSSIPRRLRSPLAILMRADGQVTLVDEDPEAIKSLIEGGAASACGMQGCANVYEPSPELRDLARRMVG